VKNITRKNQNSKKAERNPLPKLFLFITETHEYEVYAMDFKDACLTLEENEQVSPHDILSIEEHQNPNPFLDTIH